MPAPLIGITTHPPGAPDRDGLDALLAMIVAGVERAGGLPVLIPPALGDAAALGLLARLDGLLLSGGGDIDPACYGAGPRSVSPATPGWLTLHCDAVRQYTPPRQYLQGRS